MTRVLVIDDDAAVAYALERSLAASGSEVRVAPRAEEGLALVARESFDCVILDLGLPGMSGEEALPRLGRSAPGVPVVIVSAHGDARTAERCRASGAAAFLAKPFALAEVRRAVARALDERRMSAMKAPTPSSR